MKSAIGLAKLLSSSQAVFLELELMTLNPSAGSGRNTIPIDLTSIRQPVQRSSNYNFAENKEQRTSVTCGVAQNRLKSNGWLGKLASSS